MVTSNSGFDLMHVFLLILAAGLAGVVIWMRGELRNRSGELQRDLEHADETLRQLREALDRAEQNLKAQTDLAHEARIQLARQETRSEEDERRFAELAQGVLRNANSQFLQLAEEHFKRHKEGAQSNLKELIGPVGKSLDEFAKRVAEIEKVRTQDKSSIEQQVRAIGESLKLHTTETNKLVTALSAPKGGGRWGETTLRNVMEQAGLSSFCDFQEQVSDRGEDGLLRPDVVIRLPGGREIVVDSKVSIEDYLKALDETDTTPRTTLLKAHGRKVRDHIKKLGSKKYQAGFSSRVDFVALFIPGENFYVAALEHEPDLFDYAASLQVIVVTPSTLLALAKAVAYGWRQEQATENARQAAELGRDLYSRLTTLGGHVERMGKALNSAVDAYNKLGGSLSSRVLPTARKFEELQIAPPDRTMPELESIEKRAMLPDRSGELDFSVPETEDEDAM